MYQIYSELFGLRDVETLPTISTRGLYVQGGTLAEQIQEGRSPGWQVRILNQRYVKHSRGWHWRSVEYAHLPAKLKMLLLIAPCHSQEE